VGIEQTTCFFPGDHGGTSDCTTAGTWELIWRHAARRKITKVLL